MLYVRFESADPDQHGARTGIFGLANGLARSGRLSPADRVWWRTNNDWFDAAYPDPGRADPSLFDREQRPATTCWFRDSPAHLLERVPGYLQLLDRYGVAWRRCETADPGWIIYSDAVQVVAQPHSTPV